MATSALSGLGLVSDSAYDEHVGQLHRRTVLVVAVAWALLAYAWLFQAATFIDPSQSVPRPGQVAPPLLLTLAALLTAGLHRRGRAAALWLSGGLVAVLFLWPDPLRYYLAPAAVGMAGLLASRRVALLAALALSWLPGAPPGAVAAVWLTALTIFLASDFIYAMMSQAIERETAAARLEEELLARRGELRRLNDSLRNAYTLMERTNHELAEARDEADEARRLKAQFAATISHELRTPLNLIFGFSEVMHKMPEMYPGAAFTAELRGDVREIYRSTRHLLELVDDVLELSRIDQLRLAFVPEEADLAGIVREAVATAGGLFRNRPVDLVLDLPAHLPPCVVDRTRIRQVLINLLANAARFTERGEVRVGATVDEAHAEVVMCVSDTGPGVPEDEQGRIFDPFHQVSNPLLQRQGGTGLGLAICRTFVQMHGGRIWVRSGAAGEGGSRFCFTVPLRPQPPATAADWRLPGAPDPFGDSIVAVDATGRLAGLLARGTTARVYPVRQWAEARDEVARWHPKAVVAFRPPGGDDHGIEPLPWPGLPLISCYLPEKEPLLRHANVKAVANKPVTAEALLELLDGLGRVRSLLVADDDEGMTRLLQRTLSLKRPDTRVQCVHDGRQALAQLHRRRPDAMILDLAMPEMDGPSLLEAMAAEGLGDVPVIVLTAMDVRGGTADIAARRLEVSSCLGLGQADLVRYIEALAQAARPHYLAADSA